jgi:hypothetical protein
MSGKKWLAVVGLLVSFVLTLSGTVLAENNGAFCSGVEVIYAGATSNAKIVCVKHTRTDCGTNWPANTPRWFSLHSTNADAMLATVLTAQTSKTKLVLVPATGTFTEWSIMTQVYTGN